jgi:hypothetical protein
MPNNYNNNKRDLFERVSKNALYNYVTIDILKKIIKNRNNVTPPILTRSGRIGVKIGNSKIRQNKY